MAEKCRIFLRTENGGGGHEWCIEGKLVGQGVLTGLKNGGHDRGTSPYHFPMWVPPPLVFNLCMGGDSEANDNMKASKGMKIKRVSDV